MHCLCYIILYCYVLIVIATYTCDIIAHIWWRIMMKKHLEIPFVFFSYTYFRINIILWKFISRFMTFRWPAIWHYVVKDFLCKSIECRLCKYETDFIFDACGLVNRKLHFFHNRRYRSAYTVYIHIMVNICVGARQPLSLKQTGWCCWQGADKLACK